MSSVSFFSYFNPSSSKHHAVQNFKKLDCRQKTAVILATIGAAIASIPILGFGGIAAFRKVVKNYSEKKVTKVYKDIITPKLKIEKSESQTSNPTDISAATTKEATVAKSEEPSASSNEESSVSFKNLNIDEVDGVIVPRFSYLQYVSGVLKQTTISGEKQKILINAIETAFTDDVVSLKDFNDKALILSETLDKLVETKVIRNVHRNAAENLVKICFESAYRTIAENFIISQMKIVDTKLENLAALCPKIENIGKRAQYIQAINLFEQFGCTEEVLIDFLEDTSMYILNKRQKPERFSEKFANREASCLCTPEFYDYVPASIANIVEYHVDFANAHLGGHVDHGYVQEEKLIAEMPNLMNYIASTLDDNNLSSIRIREGTDQVYKGLPTPMLFINCMRVQKLEGYGVVPSVFELDTTAKPLTEPQSVNILAMSAPRLSSKLMQEQLDIKTAEDLFNTVLAGFALVKRQNIGVDWHLIHTGQIGCGVFNNNPILVYLLQRLAAHHEGMLVRFHGYSNQQANKAEQLWNLIEPKFTAETTLEECVAIIVNVMEDDYGVS